MPMPIAARDGGRQPAGVESEWRRAKSGRELDGARHAADRLRGLEHEDATPALPNVVAAASPFEPPPMTIASSVVGHGQAPLPRISSAARRPDAPMMPPPGMRAGAALPVALHRRAVLRPRGRRAQEEQLVQRELALEDVALGEPGDALDVRRASAPDGAG